MKIAIFVHCFFPDHIYGTETYTYNIAKNLQAMGHEVTVVSAIFYGEPKRDYEISEDNYNGLRVISLDKNYNPNQRVRDTYYQSSMKTPLRDVVRSLQPDVVHVTHLINHTAALLEVLAELRIPTVATFTDFYGFCFNNKLEDAQGRLCGGPNRDRSNCLACYLKVGGVGHFSNPLLRWIRDRLPVSAMSRLITLAKKLGLPIPKDILNVSTDLAQRPRTLAHFYKHYQAVIAPTTFLRKAYISNGFKENLHTMWFGVDIDRSPKPIRDSGAPLRIGYIGQMAPHKGIDILLDAFISLGECNAELVIYGPLDQDQVYSSNLIQQAKGRKVRFEATFQPDLMGTVLAGLDLLAIPSRWYENSPLVLLNALASHTPVIVSNVEGLTEFVQEGVNGYSFMRSEYKDLSRVLQRFIDSPDLAAKMSKTTSYERTTLEMTKDVLNIYPANL